MVAVFVVCSCCVMRSCLVVFTRCIGKSQSTVVKASIKRGGCCPNCNGGAVNLLNLGVVN